MRSILSPKDQRLIHIIEIFNRTDWILLNDLADKLNCSEKTVRNDLKTLTTQYSTIEIEASNTLGYRLVHNDDANENISDDIINDTLIFQIMFLLLKQSKLRLTDLESMLFATPNSIRTAIVQFNDFFKPTHSITVESRPFELTGDEAKITTVFLSRLTQSYFKKEGRYAAEFVILNQLIDKLFAENATLAELFSTDRYSLHLLFYVRIYREKNGYSTSPKSEYRQQTYLLAEDKHFKDEFFSVFGASLTDGLLNNLVNFALYEPFSTSYLQMTYFFPQSSESKTLQPFVHGLLAAVAAKLVLPSITSAEIAEMMTPKKRMETPQFTKINYQHHDYLLQILNYELNQFEATPNVIAHKDLYELYLLVEIALIVLNRWDALIQRLNGMNLTMNVGLEIIANREYQLVYEEFFRYHSDQQISFTDTTTTKTKHGIDLFITNTTDYANLKTPSIHLSNLPTDEHIKKLKRLYQGYRLDKYLNYHVTADI